MTTSRQRVIAVTGGGGGIGAAIAQELGRTGAFVVTLDPLVTVDGTEQIETVEETTADRIVAAGGSARASAVSVTDGPGVRRLFDELVEEFGGLDAVVNVAGITRPTSFARGSESDWLGVLSVHLDGYRTILEAALPIMAAAGSGAILGVTSGSGWRAADAGAYSCAKRAVASLTWQLGRHAPTGVIINAMSPIAATRMVTAALSRARPAGASAGSAASGGLSLASMPTPEQLGPLGAHLVDDTFAWCSGQVIFAGGSEIAVIDEPRLLEVVRADAVASLDRLLDAVIPGALVPAEANQATNGATNSRFAAVFDGEAAADTAPTDRHGAEVRSCVVVSDRPDVSAGLVAALSARGVAAAANAVTGTSTFADASATLASIVERDGPLDAVVLAITGGPIAEDSASDWERVLTEHRDIVEQLHTDAGWVRAVADYSKAAERTVRLITLIDATTAGGRSRAQAAAQLSRSARGATADRVTACSVSVETTWADDEQTITALVGHLLCGAATPELSGAELVVGRGWFGVRSHPRPSASITFGGPELPEWIDDALRSITRAPGHRP